MTHNRRRHLSSCFALYRQLQGGFVKPMQGLASTHRLECWLTLACNHSVCSDTGGLTDRFCFSQAHLFAPNIMEALGYSTFDVRVHGGWYRCVA